MKRNDLVKRLGDLGFPLMEATEESDANLTLADLVKSRDLRLWEGFPAVLAFSAERGMFDYEKTESRFTSSFDKLHFGLLVALSLALYKTLDLKFPWADKLYASLNKKGHRQFDGYLNAFRSGEDLHVQQRLMSSQRLKTTFNNYFLNKQSSLRDLLSTKEELGLEQALSQVFSPKQKELFFKKLKSEKLTKTEKEYFSRAVKKKVLALANTQLHQLSQRLLR
ncbi:MAG TPA: hypothetical protein PK107_06870 [Candidatus Omnitrophota bacterium]|nr:hypothetical protein [Candidatus Omnitrophota bacterium]HQO38520.1 hypothetical protein [Candidatus Omnitrophota bacterium]